MKKKNGFKRRNPLAQDLWSPKYRMRVVEDKRRKVRDKFDKREMKRGSYGSPLFLLHSI